MTNKPKPDTPLSLPLSSALIFLLRLLPMGAALLVMVYFSRTQTPGIYGQYQSYWTHYYIISAFTCLGLPSFAYSLSFAQLQTVLRRSKPTAWLLFVVLSLAGGAVFALLQDGLLPAWLPLVWMFVFTISSLQEVYLTIGKSFKFLLAMNAGYAIAFCWMHVAWAGEPLTVYELLIGVLLLAAFRMLAMGGRVLLLQRRGVADETVPPLKNLRSLWLHLGAYDIAQQLFRYVDKFVASILVGTVAFAAYYNGATEVPFLAILLGAAGSAALMQLNAKGNITSAVDTVKQTSMLLSSVVFPVFFFFLLHRYEVFRIILGRYESAVPIFTIVLLMVPVRAYNFTALLQHHGKGKIINAGAVLDLLLALLLMYPLYRLKGLPGLAAAFVISTYLQAAFYLFAAGKTTGMAPWQLLPLRSWAVKAVVFFTLLLATKYGASMLFNEQASLLLGAGAMLLLVAVSLFSDIQNIRKHGAGSA